MSFTVPDRTVGTLHIEVTNEPVDQDVRLASAFNDQLMVEFESIKTGTFNLFARSGDMLFSANSGGATATLATTVDGTVPVTLAQIHPGGAINGITVSDLYAACSVGSSHVLKIYEISNPYGPTLINTIVNPQSVHHDRLTLSGNVFLALDGTSLHIGNVSGSGWKEVSGGVLDFAVDRHFIYLLLDDGATVEVRPLEDWQTVAMRYTHALLAPKRIKISGQRLLLIGSSGVELGILKPDQAGLDVIANDYFAFSGLKDATFTGDLLVIDAAFDGMPELRLFDVDQQQSVPSSLSISDIASVASTGNLSGVSRLGLHKDILEWTSGGSYYNLSLPLQNRVATVPEQYIGQADEIIGAAIEGDGASWADVALEVYDSSETRLNGTTRLLGKDLQFLPMADSFQQGEVYRLDLFNEPYDDIVGGHIDHDLPMYLQGAPLFGVSAAKIEQLSPSMTRTGKPTTFTVRGANLDLIESLRFNGIAVPSWSVADGGGSLSFTMSFDDPGLYSLLAEQQGVKQNLPAALAVNESLAVSSIESTNSLGADRVSDSGGDTITLHGKGFQGNIEVHWLEAGAGY